MGLLEAFDVFLLHDRRAVREHLETCGLSATGLTNKHDTESDIERIVKLDNLLLERRIRLKLFLGQFLS